jgi:hypothetical protein
MGLLVSITAEAGQDTSAGASVAQASAIHAVAFELMPPVSSTLSDLLPAAARVRLASIHPRDLVVAPPEDDGETPRLSLKHNARGWPSLDRSHKGDPAVALRPAFDARFRGPGGLAAARARELLLDGDNYLAFDAFQPMNPSEGRLVVGASSTPEDSSAPILRAGVPGSPGVFDGASPAVPRAVALSSNTPAEADRSPIEILALAAALDARGVAAANSTIVEREVDASKFADLAGFEGGAEERCLAEAVYFEARSEPVDGQAAVAQVVLNRVKSGLYPSTICGVVFQNRQRHNACQFSFACDGKALRVKEPEAWATAEEIARRVLDGETYVADVGGSTHYHANYVRPRWARALQKMDTIGHHIFYSLRPGQT